MDVASQTIVVNSVLSATVIGMLGVGLFSWNLAATLFPVWIRILIVGSLFTHLIIRTIQTLLSQRDIDETKEQSTQN